MKRLFLNSLAILVTVAIAFFLGQHRGRDNAAGKATRKGAVPFVNLPDVLRTSDPVLRHAEFGNFLTGLTDAEAAAKAHKVWSIPGEPHEITERKRLFCYAWGKVGGPAALEFARAQGGVGKVAAISGALAGWASQDPHAARLWIASRLEPGERLLHNWALIDGWARHDPEAATEYVLSLRGIPGTDRFIRSIATEMVHQSGPAAAHWAVALPAGSLRQAAIMEVAVGWARTAPELASDWAFRLGDPAIAGQAADRAITEWARVDGDAAGAFLERQPASVIRDAAVGAYVAVLAAEDLQAISTWAATIRNSSLREQSLRRIADEWMARNPAAALAWLPTSGLPEDAQQQIVTANENGR